MDAQALIDSLNQQAASTDPIGARLKFELDDHSFFIDGTGDTNVISQDGDNPDCTISTSVETLAQLKSGDLNPMMAVMSGKIKITGDMSIAMKLQSLLS